MRKTIVLALFSSAVAGCSGTASLGGTGNSGNFANGGSDGGTGVLTVESFSVQSRQEICAAFSRCEGAAPSACDALFGRVQPELPAAAAAGRVTFDPSKGQACLDTLSHVTCLQLRQFVNVPPGCQSVFTPTVPVGGACFQNIDCNGRCVHDNNACPGTCEPFVALGAACVGSDDCDRFADQRCIDGKCAPRAARGQACALAADCQDGLVCADGACHEPGSPCRVNTDCPDGDYCLVAAASSGGSCATRVADGGACGEDAAHFLAAADGQCVAGDACVGASVDTNGTVTAGTCRPASDLGGACTSVPAGKTALTGCLRGLVCVNNTCAAPPTSGTCAPELLKCDPRVAFCDPKTNVCTPLLDTGAACAADGECASRSCTGGTCAAATPICHEQ